MADKSRIEWTDATWNPITGCSPVSEGCENCYAKRDALRLRGRFGYPDDEPFRVTFHEDRLDQPLRWKKPRKIFVCSMGDLFHEDVRDDAIGEIFAVMQLAIQHTFIVLTKRPRRALDFLTTYTTCEPMSCEKSIDDLAIELSEHYNCPDKLFPQNWPLPNIWIGVTAENQRMADERIPILLSTPAAVRFVSVEPMLERVDIYQWLGGNRDINPPHPYNGGLSWVICGGESGPGARPMHPDWARELRNQCINAGVPFFFKQWGEWSAENCGLNEFTAIFPEGGYGYMAGWGTKHPGAVQAWKVGKKTAGRLLDGREWNEWPNVREGVACYESPCC